MTANVQSDETTTHMVLPEAAALASIITKTLLHPIDTIKCRFQSISGARCSFATETTLSRVMKRYKYKWSPVYMYSGLPSKLVLYAPYQALYMTSLVSTREYLTIVVTEGSDGPPSTIQRCIIALSAATAGELTSSFIRVPMEAIK
eukprot:Tbor_TRINITY_DN5449_c1_g6::TRINITY_DN5449_c1_g6_i1::g.24226::m.24226/K15111/SLC25A26; solute carrier family 25 (mitochondrial S-adenosylmethionine transporter), member 26